MGCCGKGGRVVRVKDGQYFDNFKFLSTRQLAKKGVYTYCDKCQKYHTKEEYEKCQKKDT